MTAHAPKDRPIIFSAPMVRALLDGRKSQTRRIVKDVPPMPEADCYPKHRQIHPAPHLDSYCSRRPKPSNPRGMSDRWCWWQVDDRACPPQFRVPYVPGDRLWVRETWRTAKSMDAWKPKKIEEACLESGYRRPWAPIQYEADGTRENFADEPSEPGKTRVAIHLPRWLSRLTLIVTDVRVQRLQDISEEDAQAEGAEQMHLDDLGNTWKTYARGFQSIWEKINGEKSWAANPWVVAVSFKTIRANIDSAEAKAA